MKILFLAAVLFSVFAAAAQPVYTDSTFGTNGKITANTSIPFIDIVDALLQPDGKTLTLAHSDYDGVTRTVLIRYNTNGTPDAGFSGDGVADSLITPGIDCIPKAIRLQANGKILVSGKAGQYASQAFVMRYEANGSADATFGTGGILYLPSFTISGASFSPSGIESLVVLPNGKIVLLTTRSYPDNDLVLIRLNSNGTIDNSFGTNGIALSNPPGLLMAYEQPAYTHLEIQTDGKYLAGGNVGYTGYLLVRVNTNGTLDNSYGTNGSLRLSGGPTNDGLMDMMIQPDNKVIVSGAESLYGFHTYTFLLRATAAGAPDATFGNGGRQIVYTAGTGFSTTVAQTGLQADGKILVGGLAKNTAGNYTMAVLRLSANGIPDASFDGDGVALLQVNGYNNYGYVPLQQSDGKIVVAGFARNNNNISSATIGRFTATGQPDATWNAADVITLLNNGPATEDGINIHVQPADQKIINVRERTNGFEYDLCVSRHLPNGQPDAGFGTNGNAFIDLPGYYYQVFSGLSADGKITVIPDFADYETYGSLAVFRLKANGRPDSSFGQNGKRIFKSRNTDTITNNLAFATVQPDGKTLMTVYQSEGPLQMYNPRDSTFLIRLNTDGSFDNSFGTNGRKFISVDNLYTLLAVQPDGKIIMATPVYSGNSGTYVSTVRRLNTNGSTDATFNNGADRILNSGLEQIALQPDGKIAFCTYDNTVIRLTANGATDATFGTGGVADLSAYYPAGLTTYPTNMKADSSRIVLMARLYDTTTGDTYLKIVALQNNGQADTSFGQNGAILPGITTYAYNNEGLRLALQADKKVLLTGFVDAANNPGLSDFAATRLKGSHSSTNRLYTFTGSGLWSDPANWSNGLQPPTTIPAGSSVVIDPPTGSECVIDITIHVQTGASVTVRAGKQVRLPGNLIVQ